MSDHFQSRIVQLTETGAAVRVLAERPVRPSSALRWLGPTYNGYRAKVFAVTLSGGSATRIDYGPLIVWNYGSAVPPVSQQARSLPAKVFSIRGGVVHV